jgi:hypothetical protein
MTLDPYCPATYKLHDSNITFCTKCGGRNDKEITSKAVLRPVDPIDLTNATPLARTKSGRQSCPSTPRSQSASTLWSQSAMDHLHTANKRVRFQDRIFNIDVAVSALSVRLQGSPTSLSYRVNITLIHTLYCFKSQDAWQMNLWVTISEDILSKFYLFQSVVWS